MTRRGRAKTKKGGFSISWNFNTTWFNDSHCRQYFVGKKRKKKKRKKKIPSPPHCPLPAPEQVYRQRLQPKEKEGKKKDLLSGNRTPQSPEKKCSRQKRSHYPNSHLSSPTTPPPHLEPHPKRQMLNIIMPLSW